MANNPLKLICEHEFNDYDLIVEVDQENKGAAPAVRVKGPYIVAEKKNANGRSYDATVMEGAVKEYYKEYINANRALGELNHPESTEINFENACHKVISLERDGNTWIGESKVLLGTPKGDLLKGLLDNEVKIGMSTRGVGNVTNSHVVDQYKLVAVDVVAAPSAPGAWVDGILESKNFLIDEHGDIVEYAYNAFEKKVEKLPYSGNAKKELFVEAIRVFLNSI